MISPKQLDDRVALDETLADRARRGSGGAFAALVTRHRDAVYAIARNMCPTLRDTEEVLQQAFLSAWRELGSVPAGANFTTWLYGIAMKAALTQPQRDRRGPPTSLESFLPAFDRAGRLAASGGPLTPRRQPSEPGKITGLLREALECIDDQARGAFVLHHLLQLPVDEAAVILEISPADVRRDAHRALLMLGGFLDQL